MTIINEPVGYTPDEEEYKNWLSEDWKVLKWKIEKF